MTRYEHYKNCREVLGIKLTEAKRVVDRLYETVEMEPGREASFEADYRRAWSCLKDKRRKERRRRRRKRNDDRARSGPTMVELNKKSGESSACLVDEPLSAMVEEAGAAWAEEPRYSREEYTFGGIYGAAILEVVHERLDGKPVDALSAEEIEYIRLRPAVTEP